MSSPTSSNPTVSADQANRLDQHTQTLDTVDEPVGGLSLKELKATYVQTRKGCDALRNRIGFNSQRGDLRDLREYGHMLSIVEQQEQKVLIDIVRLYPDDPISVHHLSEQRIKRKREVDEQIAAVTENTKRIRSMFDKTVETASKHDEMLREQHRMVRINQVMIRSSQRALDKQRTLNDDLKEALTKQQSEDSALLETLRKS